MSERQDTLQQYVSDMLAVEQHIHQAIRRQEEDESVKAHPEAFAVISQAEQTLDNHIAALESHLQALGGDAFSPVKEAFSGVLGVAAGLIDQVRTQQVSKMLRDNYTALSLAAISYHMLHTTGLAMADQATADLALRHLKDWTPIITRLSRVVHGVVARELQDDGNVVGVYVAEESERLTQTAWDPAHVS
jgi:ferritin-like metal-binding protein YciE